jgi:hypothetical protein
MAELSITYTPKYAGCHRIGLSNSGDTAFYVYIDYSASILGTPKTIVIPVTEELLATLRLDTSSIFLCGDVSIAGYVQPCCADEGDDESKERFGFSADVSTPCQQYSLGCTRSGIEVIVGIQIGSGYNPLSPPAVNITSAQGAGATATAVISPSGTLQSIIVTNPGNGYNNNSFPITVTIDPPPGPGTQATAQFYKHTPCGPDGIVEFIDCNGDNATIKPPQPNQTINICSQSIPNTAGAGLFTTVTSIGGQACCRCYLYRIANIDKDPIAIEYLNCDGEVIIETLQPSTVPPGFIERCCIANTVYTKNIPSVLIVTNQGDCS